MSLTVPQIRRITILSCAGLSDAAVAVVMNTDNPDLTLDGPAVKYYRYRYGQGSRRNWRGIAGMAKESSGNWGSS